MLKLSISLLLIALCSQAALAMQTHVKAPENPCHWSQDAQIIHQGPHELHQVWVFAENPVFWSHLLPQSKSLELFRQQVQVMIPNLEPQSYYQAHPPAPDGEAYNKILAASGQAGQLRPISCLDALLLSQQTARLPMLKEPSEFGAFILRRLNTSGSYHYKVYFSTQDQPGLKMNAQIMSLIETDQQKGWTVWAHLHNHNFFPEKVEPFASPSPSKTDIEFARMMQKALNLENLWVTNGFHTLHVSQQEFHRFHGHSDDESNMEAPLKPVE